MSQISIHVFKNTKNFNYFKELSSDFSKYLKNIDLDRESNNQISIFSEAISNSNLKEDSAFWAYLEKLNEHHCE